MSTATEEADLDKATIVDVEAETITTTIMEGKVVTAMSTTGDADMAEEGTKKIRINQTNNKVRYTFNNNKCSNQYSGHVWQTLVANNNNNNIQRKQNTYEQNK